MRPALYWVVRRGAEYLTLGTFDVWVTRHRATRFSVAEANANAVYWPGAKVVRVVRSRRAEARARVVEAAKAWGVGLPGPRRHCPCTVCGLAAAVRALREVERG